MPAPPAYAGELCKNADDGGEHDLDITRLGRYGLCGVCRMEKGKQQRERREAGELPASLDRGRADRDMDGLREEITARTSQRPKLKAAISGLADAGERLQEALDDRDAANVHARVVVAEFKEALQLVGRVAQSLLNMSPSRNGH